MINIKKSEKTIIERILQKYLTNCEVRVFGSRITDDVKKYSDIDLVIISEKKLEKKTFYKLIEEFEYSNLNIRVDLIEYRSVSESFKKVIDRNNKLLIKL